MGKTGTYKPMWYLLAGLFLILPAGPAFAAALTIDADSQFAYAQSRLEDGAFDEAASEFNRFIHFFSDDPRVPDARFLQGTAHFRAGRYTRAAAIFDALTTDASATAPVVDAFLMLSQSHARQGHVDQAVLDLHNLMALSADVDTVDRAYYELAWLHMDRGRWQDADTAISRISAANRERFRADELARALAGRADLAYKNPTTAGVLSIVPGGGQLYCRRYQDALTAFLLNTGLIWAAWESFDNEMYALGGLVSFVGAGFYAGNIYGAVSGAHKINRDRAARFRDHLTTYRPPALSLAPLPGGALVSLTIDF
jgi:tetratricopeptide (TPR) repeat protein